jgi:cytoskeleton protein RodZ
MEEGVAPSPQSDSSNPGARLAAAREQAGMSVLQAAESLRIDVGTLQALEAGRFGTLGATVFVRGHLRHYAELVGLPVDEIEAAYAASSAKLAPQPDLRRTTTLPGNAPARRVSLPPRAALIGAIVLVLAALVWWAMRLPPGRRQGANPGSVPAAVLTPDVQSQNAAATAAVDAGPAAPAAVQPAARPSDTRDAGSRDTVAMVREVVQGNKGGAPAPAKGAAAATAAAAAPAAAPAPAAASVPAAALKPGRARLAIHFNQDSWVEVYDARGATLFHDFGGAGSERRVSGAAPLRVLLGNPDGVSVELNGRPVSLRPAAESGRPQRFLLDSEGAMSDAPPSSSQRPAAASAPP